MFSNTSDQLDGPELSDEETRAQVVEPVKRIVRTAGLQDVTGSFRFDSCNDQTEPPFRGVAGVRFVFPPDVDPDAYIEELTRLMIADGWSPGPPPGLQPYGNVVHRGQMMAFVDPHPDMPGHGLIEVRGDCRNLTDQLKAEGTVPQSITEELRAAN
ncbi:hypothetical protein [Mycolicibacterium thermoresistibile]